MAVIEFSKDRELCFLIPEECGSGVQKIAEKVAKDVEGTSGMLPPIYTKKTDKKRKQAVIGVTANCGELASELVKNIPELQELKGKRESYGFFVMENPIECVETALVIYGSDKLGTIYGLFHLSEILGVTAQLFWGDCSYRSYERIRLCTEKESVEQTEPKVKNIFVKAFLSHEPSVKYRGFFINDEWPCFGNWTSSHFGGFTSKMYDHVFEYLLRMKGNYLWPAMWSSCFLLDGPDMESMKLADEYGIYIGMSHHEPCMRSGAEYSKVRGPQSPYGDAWSYVTNKEGILRFWEDGIKRSIGHQVFPTVGMRGENDSKMLGDDSLISENVRLLKEIITKQRQMIKKYLETDGKKVPQLFAVYKEVEDYYFGDKENEGLCGFEELDEVTLLLCEDNFGNMRALPKEEERNHKGGFGMYYHLDYHGDPVSYEWVASTPLTKIWEQMTEAYEYGIREVWIVNVGDVKFQEYPLNYFMNLAYDFETWGTKAINRTKEYTSEWISSVFGEGVSEEERTKIQEVLEGYLRINSLRRPESLNDTIYHPAHYLESERMLQFCEKIEQKNEELFKAFSDRPEKDAYYSMIYFPAAASANLLKMHLYSGKNHLYATQGKAVANVYGDKMEKCVLRDEQLAVDMAKFKDGKWAGMELASHIGFTNWNDEDWRYPVRHEVRLPKKSRLVVSRADEVTHYTNQYFPVPLVIDDFAESESDSIQIQIANGGQGTVSWRIAKKSGECDWLEFSAQSGETKLQEVLILTVKKEKLPFEQKMEFLFEIRTETESVPVCVKAYRKDRQGIPEGTILSENKIFAINATRYIEKKNGVYQGEEASFTELIDFGKYESGVKVFPVTASFKETEESPSISYQIWVEEEGNYLLELHTSPANPLIFGGQLHMGVSTEEGKIQEITIAGEGYKGGEHACAAWEKAVLDGEHIGMGSVYLKKGINRIVVFAREAGVVLERLVLYPENTQPKESYLGVKESPIVNQ